MLLTAFALALAMMAEPEQLPFDEIAGIRLGDTEQSALAKIATFGPVRRSASATGGDLIEASDVGVTVCRGRVVQVTDTLPDKLPAFTALVEAYTKAYGPALPADIWYRAWERPATDPRGAARLEMSVIRVAWKAAPHFLLVFDEINGEQKASVNLNGVNPCPKPSPLNG